MAWHLIIAITETKLNHKLNCFLDGYGFEQCNSKKQAGGVGLFIKNSLNYEVIKDFNLNVEGCKELWVKISLGKAEALVAVLY